MIGNLILIIYAAVVAGMILLKAAGLVALSWWAIAGISFGGLVAVFGLLLLCLALYAWACARGGL